MSLRNCLLPVIFCCGTLAAVAQTFQAIPTPLLTQEVAFGQANECFIYFENTGADSLQLRWKSLDAAFPPEWTVDLCDFGLCYVGIPASGTMNAAGENDQPYLKLIVQPGNTAGAAWFWFRVWDVDNPAVFEDVYFSLFSPGVTATTIIPSPEIAIYPNPFSTCLNLGNEFDQAQPVRVVDAYGHTVWDDVLAPFQHTRIDCPSWPPGPYFLLTNKKTYAILRAP